MKEKIRNIYEKYNEIINYLIVGVCTTIVSLAIYYALALTILNPNDAIELQIANVVSWIFSVAFAYVTNKKYVFKSKEKANLSEIMKFAGGRIFTLIVDMFSMFILVTTLKMNDKIAKIIVQVIVIVLNYIVSKFFVFKKD